MTSYGHRVKFLEQVKNIQKASEFPPLSPGPKTNSRGRSMASASPSKVKEELSFSYEYDDEAHTWCLDVHGTDGYIRKVEFVLTRDDNRENPVSEISEAPYSYAGDSRDAGSSILCAITFQVR